MLKKYSEWILLVLADKLFILLYRGEDILVKIIEWTIREKLACWYVNH